MLGDQCNSFVAEATPCDHSVGQRKEKKTIHVGRRTEKLVKQNSTVMA